MIAGLCRATATVLGLLGATVLSAAHPEVVVVSDLLVPPTAFTSPTAAQPCPYLLLPGRERALGSSVAGEKIPSPSEIETLLAATLRTQNYVPAVIGGPRPQLVLICTWGNANLELDESETTDPLSGETTTSNVASNTAVFARLIGLDRLKTQTLSLAEENRFLTILREDRLYLMVAALDAAALAAGERRLIWRTWISIPDLRHSLQRDLPTMLARAAPFFGHDTAAPVIISGREGRSEVEIGETTVVPEPP